MRLFSILFIVLFSVSISAQNSLSGKITDHNTGETLIGVNVYFPELLKGSVSDKDGKYFINNIPKGKQIIRVSYIGYETINKKFEIDDKSIIIDFEMDFLVIAGEEIVISGNFTSTQHNNTVTISTLNSRQIEQSGSPTLMESIASTPGVDIISKGPGIGSPIIRGLSLSNILFLNNGIPLNNYQFSENHPYMIDEFGVKRVEIIKGPASLIYGSGAVAGVINVIDEEPAYQEEIEGAVGFKYFGNTEGLNGNLNIKGRSGNFFWGVNGGASSFKDYRQGNGEIVPNSRFNKKSFKVNLGLIGKKAIYKLIYQYGKDELGLAVKPAFALAKENERKNEVWFQDLTDHLLISQNKFFFGDFRMDLILAYQLNKRKLQGSEFTPVFEMVDMQLGTFSFRLKGQYEFSDNFSLIAGTQGFTQSNTNFEAPDRILPDANIFDISFYTLAKYEINNILVLEAGLRYSYKIVDVPLQESSGHSKISEENTIEFNKDYSNLSASIGTTINLNEKNLLRLNLASAYRSPNLAELTQDGMHGTRYEQGNPNLTNQQNLEIDLGYHLHTKHTTLDISGFYNNIYNYIFLSPTNDSTDNGYRIYKYLQTPSVLYGGEIMLHVHPCPIHWLHIEGSYSYIVAKKKSGDYLPLIPANKFKLGLRFTKDQMRSLRNTYFRIGGKYAFEQSKPSEFESPTNSYFILDMGIGTEIKVKNQLLLIDITATNLLNKTYYDHLSTLKDMGIYNIGRSVNLSVKIPFGIKN